MGIVPILSTETKTISIFFALKKKKIEEKTTVTTSTAVSTWWRRELWSKLYASISLQTDWIVSFILVYLTYLDPSCTFVESVRIIYLFKQTQTIRTNVGQKLFGLIWSIFLWHFVAFQSLAQWSCSFRFEKLGAFIYNIRDKRVNNI